MAPYSNEYILQYIAKLETGDYTKGLDKIQGKTSSSTGALNKSFSGLSTVIKKWQLQNSLLQLLQYTLQIKQDLLFKI